MFFSGDPSTRKRVDLGGRSSKERDREKLLEVARLERNRRLSFRNRNAAALKIQKCFRGRKVMEIECSKARQNFHEAYGKHCEFVHRHCFDPDSKFLPQLFFFFKAQEYDDFAVLVGACSLLLKLVQLTGDVRALFVGMDYDTNHVRVEYRVARFSFICIQAVYQNREQLEGLFLLPSESNSNAALLLRAVALLLDGNLPWACKIVGYLSQRDVFNMFRHLVMQMEREQACRTMKDGCSLEQILLFMASHIGKKPCICANHGSEKSFISQILTIPFLWQEFPNLKEVFTTLDTSRYYIHCLRLWVERNTFVLPNDVLLQYSNRVYLLGNILEIAEIALLHADCTVEMAIDLAVVIIVLYDSVPLPKSSSLDGKENEDGDDTVHDEMPMILRRNFEQLIKNGVNTDLLLQLINVLFRGLSNASGCHHGLDNMAEAVGAACALLHLNFERSLNDRTMTILAYRTEVVQILWNFMKQCHENEKWPSLLTRILYLPGDDSGWLLPLAVFCPVYKHLLTIVDNEEFYELEKPLSLRDTTCLIFILRKALWYLLWENPEDSNSWETVRNISSFTHSSFKFVRQKVVAVTSELLSQLQDWNNRRQFTSFNDFHADGIDDLFVSQALIDGSEANVILKQAPFLIPFTFRVKIFGEQLSAMRRSENVHYNPEKKFRIRRNHIMEDSYHHMSSLSEEDLRGLIRVSFINEFGVEEAGIDGGGIFKDFMEKIMQTAFNVQHGLFKETADHLLYPNPGSQIVHEQHLQLFHFLGSLLAKALFEGILVDLPFATFFLSKLKHKFNYLNDLPTLDSELYRHLIFLKHYQGDVSELELYFIIMNNEYGEQTEHELLPGGRNIRVTNENVITFVHLVSNHRLNLQIRHQSFYFLRGFQQLIERKWIDMFNEYELQLLISGSLDSLDIHDLQVHTNYTGGYNKEHYVIKMFWEILKSFSSEHRKKFLKFVTGCSRGPLLGFRNLEPHFCIHRVVGDPVEIGDRLPTAATCVNLLKLPPYRSKEQMENKLVYAINADAGFYLS